MKQNELIPHLFRTEFSKICSVLTRLLGIEHCDTAEDIVSETFLSALETWTYKGIPENPVAWLYTVAKNKARNHFNRTQLFTDKIIPQLSGNLVTTFELDLSEKNITDSQLQMLFSICHPAIPNEAQVALALRILCGFGIEELASAFLTNKETINKRLYRAKEKLKTEKIKIEFPSESEINTRLDAVLTTLYLLFNEGYYSESNDNLIREDLCMEAMRLTMLLIKNEQTDIPPVNALYALMCLHASRFPARINNSGEMILYHEQNESLWNYELISMGAYYLNKASQGDYVSQYHLEAAIAYWHTQKNDTIEKWENILQLYNRLLEITYSPIVALNRAYALSKVKSNAEAIEEAEKLQLTDSHFYFILLAELYKKENKGKAKSYLVKALELSKTKSDKFSITKLMDSLR
ncbi:ECF subfamily RNA polymerase sigma-24 subunit [Sporocytophaga myxococcoides]|uniref:ECF subfamily RNA polymerase sigma-24 subunit n=1 Tax=Sporocytophaga myxococcoides TaxID=153721 RepID=A0A098LB95_9BACT|nr:sigma-70 family RNA polymerase sigma factor [Sporocytophaga myxococcoides]GAL84190.1 ECF subfamily RNA polymerase sigma-24 subunit [Sporocytophaga myxococcoides]